MHHCLGDLWNVDGLYGEAISQSVTMDDGYLWVHNGEYSTRVRYCPYCGWDSIGQEKYDADMRAIDKEYARILANIKED